MSHRVKFNQYSMDTALILLGDNTQRLQVRIEHKNGMLISPGLESATPSPDSFGLKHSAVESEDCTLVTNEFPSEA